MSQDFSTILVKDSRLMCTDKIGYQIFKGGQSMTPYVYNAISQGASSITWNVQVP
jgi:hypothetical protein